MTLPLQLTLKKQVHMLESIRQIYVIMQSLLRSSLTWTWGARPRASLRRIPSHSLPMPKREYATKGGSNGDQQGHLVVIGRVLSTLLKWCLTQTGGAEPFWLPHKGNVTDLDVTVSSRHSTLRSKPFEEFKAVGVSFNDAQSALATIYEGAVCYFG